MSAKVVAMGAIVLGAAVSVIAISRKASAAQNEYIPSVEEVMAAGSLVELQTYYDIMNELYVGKIITPEEYSILYNAYRTRFYQLSEVVP